MINRHLAASGEHIDTWSTPEPNRDPNCHRLKFYKKAVPTSCVTCVTRTS